MSNIVLKLWLSSLMRETLCVKPMMSLSIEIRGKHAFSLYILFSMSWELNLENWLSEMIKMSPERKPSWYFFGEVNYGWDFDWFDCINKKHEVIHQMATARVTSARKRTRGGAATSWCVVERDYSVREIWHCAEYTRGTLCTKSREILIITKQAGRNKRTNWKSCCLQYTREIGG